MTFLYQPPANFPEPIYTFLSRTRQESISFETFCTKKVTKTINSSPSKEPVTQFKSTAVLPYVKDAPEPLRRCPQQQGIRAVFKFDATLRSHLVRPKETVNPPRQESVVYRIPCECSKIYIGETGRPMPERMKEHERDTRLVRTQTCTVSEHANKTGHHPLWNKVKVC